MSILPRGLQNVIEGFGRLPGVGPRTAERYAGYLLRYEKNAALSIAEALDTLHASVKLCPRTFALINADEDESPLYRDPKRDRSLVAVVSDYFDMVAIEKANLFKGTYHVLGGLISPIDNVGPEQLTIPALLRRIDEDNVTELILALNAGVEGDTTALYLQQQLTDKKVHLSRLARGIPVGLDLEYADHITLANALEGRQAF